VHIVGLTILMYFDAQSKILSSSSTVSVRGYVVTSEGLWRVFMKGYGWTAPSVPGPPHC
jgi:hypothetical protein